MRSQLASSMFCLFVLAVVSRSYGESQSERPVFDRAPSCNCAPVINVGPSQTGGRCCDDVCSNTTRWLGHVDTEVKVIDDRVDDINARLDTVESELTTLQQGNHTHDGEDHSLEDFYNYYDEVAQSICTAVNADGGWVYAVRRTCPGTRTCATICTDPQLKAQDAQVANRVMTCIESLHIYKGRPKFNEGAGLEKLGLKTYRYKNCSWTGCGPNYCCCRA